MTAGNRIGSAEAADPRLRWLYGTSGIAALLAAALFLIAVVDLVVTGSATGSARGWLTPLQDNWLVVIFKLLAGVSGFGLDRLQVFNVLDFGILALVALLYVGLYVALRRTSRIWSIIALVQPFLGMALFVVTKSAGRSAVMGAGLVICAVMLRGKSFSRMIAAMGLLASALLWAGDLSAGAIPPSSFVAALFGIGYLLLTAWLFLAGRRLLQVGGFVG